MIRADMISTIGREYLISNIENDEYSYPKAFSVASLTFTPIRNSAGRTFEKLDIRFVKDNVTVLIETKQNFTKADEEKEDYVRTIVQTNLYRELKNVNKITLSFLGTGFLRYQVRNMIGTLIEIGEGKRKSEDIIDIIAQEDRRKAGKTAAPEGLYLKDVLY